MFGPESLKGWWDALTAIGTVSMALATLVVILQSRRLRRDDDRHHQDQFRPICVLTPYDGVDPRPYRSELLTTVTRDESRPRFGIVEVRCALRNIGPGPALNVRIAFRLHSLGGYQTEGCELGPLHAGEARGSASEPLRVAVFLRSPLQDQEFAQIPDGSWEIILTYEDVFGQRFYSMHPKTPHQMNRLRRVPGSDKFEAPQQPWVKLGKGEPPAFSGESLLTGFVGENKPTVRQICIRIMQRIYAIFSRR